MNVTLANRSRKPKKHNDMSAEIISFIIDKWIQISVTKLPMLYLSTVASLLGVLCVWQVQSAKVMALNEYDIFMKVITKWDPHFNVYIPLCICTQIILLLYLFRLVVVLSMTCAQNLGTLWPDGRIRLLARHIISLSSLCRLAWKHLSIMYLPGISWVCLRLSFDY